MPLEKAGPLILFLVVAFAQENDAMRGYGWARWLPGLAMAVLAGCAESSMVRQGQAERFEQQQLAQSRQIEEYQNRLNALDRDNQELETLLAQARQKSKVLDDQLAVLRDQLGGVTSQLARLREEKDAADQKAQTLTASMRRQGGVSISPNNSYLESLPTVDLPGIHVRRDGDVIRIELPTSSLFEPATARLLPGAARLVTTAAADLSRLYPDRRIGVEGHTDNTPVQNVQWRSNTQLSTGRAIAVHDLLIAQSSLRPEQLFVVGHGSNCPIASNSTAEGPERNRRVELVVYPEKVAR